MEIGRREGSRRLGACIETEGKENERGGSYGDCYFLSKKRNTDSGSSLCKVLVYIHPCIYT
jgi:hypothetical protein